jgi:hypothetical protein
MREMIADELEQLEDANSRGEITFFANVTFGSNGPRPTALGSLPDIDEFISTIDELKAAVEHLVRKYECDRTRH